MHDIAAWTACRHRIGAEAQHAPVQAGSSKKSMPPKPAIAITWLTAAVTVRCPAPPCTAWVLASRVTECASVSVITKVLAGSGTTGAVPISGAPAPSVLWVSVAGSLAICAAAIPAKLLAVTIALTMV